MSGVLGADPGQISQPDDNNLSNTYATIPDQSVESVATRINPQQVTSGTLRGTQFVGSETLQIDSTKNLITIKESVTQNSSVLRLGQIATGYLGLAVSDGVNDTLFAGKDSSGNTVIKIAKNGFDAKTATSDQLIFNSSQDIFKISQVGTANITSVPGSSANVILNHNLGFVPSVIANIDTGTSVNPLPYALPIVTGSTITVLIYIYVSTITSSTIQFVVQASNAGSPQNYTIKYYLLQETAT